MVRVQTARVAIFGLARDCEKALQPRGGQRSPVVRAIEKTGALFRDYVVHVLEDGSKDATRHLLRTWAKDNPRVSLVEPPVQTTGPKLGRLRRLARARNALLASLTEDQAEYVVMVDLDNPAGWTADGFLHFFTGVESSVDGGWDVICANGINTYGSRDLFLHLILSTLYSASLKAVVYPRRHPGPKPVGVFGEVYGEDSMWDAHALVAREFPFRPTVDRSRDHHSWIDPTGWYETLRYAPMRYYACNEPPFRVDSCFGGLAIYRASALRGCSYDENTTDYEHISMHRCMAEKHGARLLMHPGFRILYPDLVTLCGDDCVV